MKLFHWHWRLVVMHSVRFRCYGMTSFRTNIERKPNFFRLQKKPNWMRKSWVFFRILKLLSDIESLFVVVCCKIRCHNILYSLHELKLWILLHFSSWWWSDCILLFIELCVPYMSVIIMNSWETLLYCVHCTDNVQRLWWMNVAPFQWQLILPRMKYVQQITGQGEENEISYWIH